MATDVDHSYYGWPRDELPERDDSKDTSIAQMLDHGSISFGRFAVEPLAWEKRSVFTHNQRQEELEKFKAPGLVAQKKAYFEEYYRKIRALKALQQSEQTQQTQQAEIVLDYGNASISSEAGEDDEISNEPQSIRGVEMNVNDGMSEDPNKMISQQDNDSGLVSKRLSGQASLSSTERSMGPVEHRSSDINTSDMHLKKGQVEDSKEFNIESSRISSKGSSFVQEDMHHWVGLEASFEEIATVAESSGLGNNNQTTQLIIQDKSGQNRENQVLAPLIGSASNYDHISRLNLPKSSNESIVLSQSVGGTEKLSGNAGRGTISNKLSASGLQSYNRPSSSQGPRGQVVSRGEKAGSMRPASSQGPRRQLVNRNEKAIIKGPAYSQGPCRRLVNGNKDGKVSSKVESSIGLKKPVAHGVSSDRRPASASSQRPVQQLLHKVDMLSGKAGPNTVSEKTNTIRLPSDSKRLPSASSKRPARQFVTKDGNLSGQAGYNTPLSKSTANRSPNNTRPASASSRRSLVEADSTVTVPRPFSFATDRRAATTRTRDTTKQLSKKVQRISQPSQVQRESGLKVQDNLKRAAITCAQGSKLAIHRIRDERRETSEMAKHSNVIARTANVIGKETARSFNLPYQNICNSNVVVGEEGNINKVLMQALGYERTTSNTPPDRILRTDDKKINAPHPRDLPTGMRRPLTADSSNNRRNLRKTMPRWR